MGHSMLVLQKGMEPREPIWLDRGKAVYLCPHCGRHRNDSIKSISYTCTCDNFVEVERPREDGPVLYCMVCRLWWRAWKDDDECPDCYFEHVDHEYEDPCGCMRCRGIAGN